MNKSHFLGFFLVHQMFECKHTNEHYQYNAKPPRYRKLYPQEVF